MVHHYTNDGREWVVIKPPARCVWAKPMAYTVEEAIEVAAALAKALREIEAKERFARVAAGYQAEIAE